MLHFCDYIKKNPKKNGNHLVIYGAGIVGRLTLEALNQKNINVDFFCDSDPRKLKIKVKNVEIISPETLEKLNKETNIFVSIQYFSSIIPFLEKKGFKNLYKVTDLLSNSNLEEYYNITNLTYQNKEYIVIFLHIHVVYLWHQSHMDYL